MKSDASQRNKAIIIVGPTSSGKSDFAVNVAHYLKKHKHQSAIISADSRQVYKGFDIGAGKITKKEMRGIPHYGLDIASPLHTYTVSQYQTYTKKILQTLWEKNITPIICGGTGLYIDAVLYDYTLPRVKPNRALRTRLEKLSTQELFTLIQKKSPKRAQTIDPHNRRRLIRALEILQEQKEIIPLKKEPAFDAYIIGINPSKNTLYKRIHDRLIKRLRIGMLAEMKRLHAHGLSYTRMESFGLEYRYGARFLQKKISKTEMITQLEQETKKYTKRQMTWFKRNKKTIWLTKPHIASITNAIIAFISH